MTTPEPTNFVERDRFSQPASEFLMKRIEQLSMLTNSLASAVSYLDTNFCFRYVNATYERWFKKKPHEIIGTSVRVLLGEEGYKQRLPYLNQALAGESLMFHAGFTTFQEEPDGTAEIKYTPDFDASGAVQGIVVTVTDVTEFARALRQAKLLAKAREEFIALASHELKTPLTSLSLKQQLARAPHS